jgi:hypothetical protein
MTTDSTVVTRYDLRLNLVRDVVKAHSKLSEQAASELAARMLHALDTVPELVR